MSAAKFADPFLTEPSIKLLLSRLKASPKVIALDQLRSDFHALHPGGRIQFDATVRLIETIGFVKRKDIETIIVDGPCLASSVGEATTCLAQQLMQWLSGEGHILEFVQALQFDENDCTVVLDTLRVPWRLNHVRHLLRELGVFFRDDVNNRHWKINAQYSEGFLEAAKLQNLTFQRGPMSPEELVRLQERLDELGEDAEKWVLLHEKRRLSKHPLVTLVRRVSEVDVSAGYDIVSFASLKSILHDRFLEVKSYSDRFRFFWSIGEIEQAKEFGNRYVLVLVDRRKISDPNYQPIEISDPYNHFFGSTPNDWEVKSTEWVIERR